jgi:ribosome-binding protein aMBF1 (putative translation factor)
MPARKAAAEGSVETQAPKTNPALPGKEIRKVEDVAPEIRRLREEGVSTQEIHEKLQVSFDVINQLFLQSYKMSMNTFEVFEAQEKIRLGL